MSDVILVINAGSSSIKFALFPADEEVVIARHTRRLLETAATAQRI